MPLRVLIVDDNPTFLEAAGALLERQQLDVVGRAASAAEALRRAEETHPDVALVDVSLGRESGLDLARQLAARPVGAAVGVILISTRAEDDLTDLIADCPILGFIPKAKLTAGAIEHLVGAGSSR
jgi:CheY-like chemotaxis protein